jgi:glycosyltransferase involved in cell wall biosynthesis
MFSEQAKPVEDPDAETAGILPGLRAIAEGHELTGEIACGGPSQFKRVPLPAAEEPARTERRGADMDDAHVLSVALLTLGDPHTVTGGYLYHQRVAQRAQQNLAAVRFWSLPPGRFPLPARAAPPLMREVLHSRPDVLVVDSIAAAFLAPWLIWRHTALPPLVAIAHQPPGGIDHGMTRRLLQSRLDRAAYRHTQAVLAASEPLAVHLCAAGIGRDLLHVIPPGRDVSLTAVPVDSSLRAGRQAAVLMVGNWVPRKGVLELLEAVSRLPADAVTLHLVGGTDIDRSYAARVRARLAAPDLSDRVVVHGPVSVAEVAGFYAAADVFALASTAEPYGTAYGEAMAAGLPVVGWAAGNLPYLADSGEGGEGMVVPPGDIAALADALCRLAKDEPLRRQMGERARCRAGQLPTWDDTATMFFAELRRVVRSAHQRKDIS